MSCSVLNTRLCAGGVVFQSSVEGAMRTRRGVHPALRLHTTCPRMPTSCLAKTSQFSFVTADTAETNMN